MFKEEKEVPTFDWAMLGDVNAGSPNLGMTMDVVVYRLMQLPMRDIMIVGLGPEKTDEIMYKAGELFW